MSLTVLVCTIPERHNKAWSLYKFLRNQPGYFDILQDARDKSVPTGYKRNALINSCDSEYFCFLDDDDIVTTDYIPELLNAIKLKPDVVTFNGWMTTNGANRVDWEIRLGENYEERNGKYYRFPNHLCVFKKSLVEHIKFPDIWKGEDYIWAKAVRDSGVLKNEIHIDKQLYHYDYWTHK